MREEVARRIETHREKGGTLVAIEAIALIESGIAAKCDTVIGVLAPAEARVQRVVAREGIERAYAQARIASQKPDEFFRAHCDYVLENTYQNSATFIAACRELLERLLSAFYVDRL